MSLTQLRHLSNSNRSFVEQKEEDENSFELIESKLNKLAEEIDSFESHNTALTRAKYEHIQKENMKLIRDIEDLICKEVIKEIGEEKNLVFRFQKVLSGYKKKFNSLLQVKKSLIEEQPQRIPLEESNYEDDDQDETDNLLESMKIETYEEYINEREKRIRTIHKDMGVIHEIMKGMGQTVHRQSEDLEIIVDDVNKTEEHTAKANVDLAKTAKFKSSAPKRYYKILALLFFFTIVSIFMIYNRGITILSYRVSSF